MGTAATQAPGVHRGRDARPHVFRVLAGFLCVLLLAGGSRASAQAKRPTVFLVGDSISLFYTPGLRRDLGPKVDFSRKNEPETSANLDIPGGANGGDSWMVLVYLRAKFVDSQFHPDILLVNAGLHDIKRDPKTEAIAITPETYEANLIALADLAAAHHARLVWINTTPVDDARHNRLSTAFLRYNADVERCNSIAERVFSPRGVSIIDLYDFTLANNGLQHFADHVHFDPSMRLLHAAYIAGFVQSLLK